MTPCMALWIGRIPDLDRELQHGRPLRDAGRQNSAPPLQVRRGQGCAGLVKESEAGVPIQQHIPEDIVGAQMGP